MPENTKRLLETLTRLLAISAGDLENALNHACNAVGDALHADKVDAFLYDDSRDCLIAQGTSSTPLSSLQKRLGLDILQISNGGRTVEAYMTGNVFVSGRLLEDSEELRGVRVGLKIQSEIGVPLVINGRRVGLILIASQQPDFFTPKDVEFAESVAQWVAMVAHRAELVEQITRHAIEQGRRKVAEELITVLAHDLRNYISPIHARLHLLRARANKQNRPEDIRDADLSLKGVDRLARLISDILDVARLDQGIFQIQPQPVDLVEATQEISREIATPAHELAVNVEDDVIVAADPQRLRQCMDNIISNAIQHSPQNAPVRLVVKKRIRDEKLFGILEVHNEGPGIPMELMPRLFERFSRGPDSRGLGLGLYMAKRIAVAHGGELTVDSQIGKSVCFSLRLPCYQQ